MLVQRSYICNCKKSFLVVVASIAVLLFASCNSWALSHDRLDRRARRFGGSVISASAGGHHSVALTADGRVWVWGSNGNGQIGDGTERQRRRPVRIIDDVMAISAGDHHTTVITNDGELWSWGTVSFDFGYGHALHRSFMKEPRMVTDNVAYVSSGLSYMLFIDANHTLWTAGSMYYSPHIYWRERISIAFIMDDVRMVSAGRSHAMAITMENVLWGWGTNRYGQLGNGTTIGSRTPVEIMEDIAFVSASQGASVYRGHTMAITTDGTLWGWGGNSQGQLGDGTNTNQYSPVRIMEDVIYVSAAGFNTAAITSDNGLWVWGSNLAGQVGDGTTVDSPVPLRVMDNVVSVSISSGHVMAITSNGELWVWGSNSMGQLGDGTTINRHSPVRIK